MLYLKGLAVIFQKREKEIELPKKASYHTYFIQAMK